MGHECTNGVMGGMLRHVERMDEVWGGLGKYSHLVGPHHHQTARAGQGGGPCRL